MNMPLDVTGIMALVVSGYTLYRMWRMTPKEVASTDAEASEKYASASTKFAELNKDLMARVELLETKAAERDVKMYTLEAQVKVLTRRLKRRDDLIAEWQIGINILIQDLCNAKLEPSWKPSKQLEDILREDNEDTEPTK